MNRFIKAFASAVCAASVILGGVSVFAAEDKHTPSGITFGDIGDSIEKWAAENSSDYVAFSAAVFTGDEILYEGAFGYSDRENQIAADTDTVYEWGSITKLTVWVSVMQLYEQGRIDLNADIRTYLPEGFFQNLKYDDPITMLNLMNHNAGWGEGTWALQVDSPEKVVPLGQALRDTEPPQMYRPGEVCSYSNWGAALAGYIVECITGESYADYVHKNIFEPLGMENTAILPDHSDNEKVGQKRLGLVSYSNIDGATWNNNGSQLLYINLYPAGSATGTISDMALFAQSFIREDHPLFLKKETLDLLLSPSLFLGNTEIVTCCHGLWSEEYENATLLGHNGGTNACSSDLQFDLESGIGTVFMTTGGVNAVPELIFGAPAKQDVSSYSGPVTSEGSLAGIYTGTRSIRRGIYKIWGLMSLLPVNYSGNNVYDAAGMATLDQISDNVIVLNQNGLSYPGYVYKVSDGTTIITLGSQSFAEDRTILPSLILTAAFILITLGGVFSLIYKLIGMLTKKFNNYRGFLFMALAQLFRIICILPPLTLIGPYLDQYGLTRSQGNIFFGTELACFAVFAAAIIVSFIGLFSKKSETAPKYKYIMSILGNGTGIAMMLFLEFLTVSGI